MQFHVVFLIKVLVPSFSGQSGIGGLLVVSSSVFLAAGPIPAQVGGVRY